jgi:excisionase family DNA binding protein
LETSNFDFIGPAGVFQLRSIINERTSMTNNQSLLLRSSEAASRLGISKSTLHRWVKAGRIECIQVERNAIYFTPEALAAFVEKHRKLYRPRNLA